MKLTKLILCNILIVTLWSCDSDEVKKESQPEEPSTPEIIDPSNANQLSSVLIFPSGSTSSNGNPPAPSQENEAPIVENTNPTLTSSNGSTAPLDFSFNNVDGNLAGCYAQVEGADDFFTIPYNQNSSSTGELSLPLGIPTNVDAGDFRVNFCVYDRSGRVSNIVSTSVSVLRLGTGALQISLSWNTETDQDLFVTDPNGDVISFSNTTSSSGGMLDRDDTDGFGPENVFWEDEAPDGTYSVSVNDFDGTLNPNEIFVTISGPSTNRRFTGTTQNGSTFEVTTFTKEGNTISFQ